MPRGLKSIDVQAPLPGRISKIRARNSFSDSNNRQNKIIEISTERAEELINSGRSDIILSVAMDNLEIEPNDEKWLTMAAKNCGDFLSKGESERLFNRIVSLNIDSEEVNRFLIEGAYKNKDWDTIIELSDRVNRDSGDGIEVIMKVIDAFKKAKKNSGLIEFIPKLGSYSDLSTTLLRELASSYYKEKNYFHSSKIWNRLGAEEINNRELLFCAKANYNSKNYQKTIVNCIEIEKRGKEAMEVNFLKLRAQYMSGLWGDCIESCTIAIANGGKRDMEISEYRTKSVFNMLNGVKYWFEEIAIGT